ncbi:unnamed protein product, partial [Musa banksii]
MAKPLLERHTSNQRREEEDHEWREQLRRGEDITRTAKDRGLKLRSIDLEESEAYPTGASKGIGQGRGGADRQPPLHPLPPSSHPR